MRIHRIILAAACCLSLTSLQAQEHNQKHGRLRDYGITPGIFEPGQWNAITDVPGVTVGHVTLIGNDMRTGVTAIVPHQGNLFTQKTPAAVYVGNGFGKLSGTTQVRELGNIEVPVILTNTLSVAQGIEGVIDYTIARNPWCMSVNAVVGETNDCGLNNIQKRFVKAKHVVKAIESAQSGPVEEGPVGAGAGTVCFGFKGGIGTSSRVLPAAYGGYTVGVLVQTNYGGVLEIDGVKVGEALGHYSFKNAVEKDRAAKAQAAEQAVAGSCCQDAAEGRMLADAGKGADGRMLADAEMQKADSRMLADAGKTADGRMLADAEMQKADGRMLADAGKAPDGDVRLNPDGSCMMVLITDAPVDARNLERMAKRVMMGMAKTGGIASNGSGDYVIALSVCPENLIDESKPFYTPVLLQNEAMSPLFEAAIEATEEALWNSLFAGYDCKDRNGNTVRALPVDEVVKLLKARE